MKSGCYRSASEVVREGLRLLEIRQKQTEFIQSAIDEGLASAPIPGKKAMEHIRRNLKEQHGV